MKRSDAPLNPLQGLFCNGLDKAHPSQLTATVNDSSLMQGVRSLAQQELNRRQMAAIKEVLR